MPIVNCREQAIETIRYILTQKNFYVNQILIDGVLNVVNQIADYYEEGVKYYPELLLLGDSSYLSSLQGRWYTLYKGDAELSEFYRLMKLCVPLSVNNWSIYVVFNGQGMEYGVASAEIKECSLSLYSQMINLAEPNDSILCIRNVGGKNVELLSASGSQVISMTLDEFTNDLDDNINNLSKAIVKDCPESYKSDRLLPFVIKVIKDALNEGHGNLIVVCKKEHIKDVTDEMTGGTILYNPISIPELLFQDERNQTNESSVAIKSNVSLIKSMINHDGITIFSSEGCVLGYHFIVNNKTEKGNPSIGGSRSKAFDKLVEIDSIVARFFKSQDGKTKFK